MSKQEMIEKLGEKKMKAIEFVGKAIGIPVAIIIMSISATFLVTWFIWLSGAIICWNTNWSSSHYFWVGWRTVFVIAFLSIAGMFCDE